ncbi:hypothetical protein NQZ68_039128 [Dissostichus eleginoides]|nr:hypothetical protein NQZ68_039128 [Dissostichus eleginoides]
MDHSLISWPAVALQQLAGLTEHVNRRESVLSEEFTKALIRKLCHPEQSLFSDREASRLMAPRGWREEHTLVGEEPGINPPHHGLFQLVEESPKATSL